MLKMDLEPQHTEKDPEVWNTFVLGGDTVINCCTVPEKRYASRFVEALNLQNT